MAKVDKDARVTVNDIGDVIDTSLADNQIRAFINTAHRLVVDLLTGEGLAESTLTEIERYLAAHLLTLRDPRPQREKIGSEYSVTYQGKSEMGLQATQYGQMALTLDTTGKLAGGASMALKQASFVVHGTNDP